MPSLKPRGRDRYPDRRVGSDAQRKKKLKRPGRPLGSAFKSLSDYFTEAEVLLFIDDLKTRAETDDKIAIFLAEHLWGKPLQAIDVSSKGKPLLVIE